MAPPNDNPVVLGTATPLNLGISEPGFDRLGPILDVDRFKKEYPSLAKTKEVFPHLSTHYPECCWKVLYCIVKKDTFTPLTDEFVQRAIPSMGDKTKRQNESLGNLEERSKELLLCELYFAQNCELLVKFLAFENYQDKPKLNLQHCNRLSSCP